MLQGGAKKGFSGQEQNHKLRRVGELRPVSLLGQGLDMVLHMLGETLQMNSGMFVVCGIGHIEQGRQRRLGVDHQRLATWQTHHHVRPFTTALGAFLLVKIAMRLHPGQFDHPPQLHLAPATTPFRSAQGRHQPHGLGAQRLLRLLHGLDLLGEPGIGRRTILLYGLVLATDLFQAVLQGLDQGRDRLLLVPQFLLGQM